MAVLHNRISQEELKRRLMEETEPRTTISFYQYFFMEDPQAFRDQLYVHLNALKVFGRIYVAQEGINAQISVPTPNFEAFRNYLYSIEPLHGLRLNIAVDDDGKSFWVLKIKVRDKIVADGIDDPAFDMRNKGRYVDAATFNQLTDDPDTIVVDMRNHYEYEVGHFDRAIEVPSDTFREQLPMAVDMLKNDKEKNIIMYCTGGIRCEKASAYMKKLGFETVYHLKGGILKYLEETPPEKSMWEGECFVFDQRVAVGHGLALGSHILCPSCRHPVSIEETKSEHYEEGVACPHCFDTITPEKRAAAAERQKQIKLAELRGEKHIGAIYDPEG